MIQMMETDWESGKFSIRLFGQCWKVKGIFPRPAGISEGCPSGEVAMLERKSIVENTIEIISFCIDGEIFRRAEFWVCPNG